MSSKSEKTGRISQWMVPALAAVVVVVAFLVVQHLRHGWPFSLHHGMGVPSGRDAGAAGAGADSQGPDRVAVHVDPRALAELRIQVEEAGVTPIGEVIRAVATVVPDEERLSHVHTRVAGWIERLYVNTTGETVKAGAPLAGIFSQELFASQLELISALEAAGTGPESVVVEGARTRLRVLGMTDAEIRALERRGAPRRLVTVVAPRGGVVLRRNVTVGTSVDPSTELFTIADLTEVWVFAELPEAEAAGIKVGTTATIDLRVPGKKPFEAPVEFVYPVLTDRTRTLRARFSMPNRDGALKPGMYGTAEFRTEPRQALTVSRDAIVDTGDAQYVFVQTEPGRFEPRQVQLGARLSGRVEIRGGVEAGARVVSSGVFLVDSESRLRATGGGVGHAGHGGGAQAPAPQQQITPPAGKPGAHEDHGGKAPADAGSTPPVGEPGGHEGHGRASPPPPPPHQGHAR